MRLPLPLIQAFIILATELTPCAFFALDGLLTALLVAMALPAAAANYSPAVLQLDVLYIVIVRMLLADPGLGLLHMLVVPMILASLTLQILMDIQLLEPWDLTGLPFQKTLSKAYDDLQIIVVGLSNFRRFDSPFRHHRPNDLQISKRSQTFARGSEDPAEPGSPPSAKSETRSQRRKTKLRVTHSRAVVRVNTSDCVTLGSQRRNARGL